MAVGNRLTVDEIAALSPGDTVTIESGADLARPRVRTGTVVRICPTYLVVRVEGPRGGTFVETYSLRTGLREGRAGRAELVQASVDAELGYTARRRTQHIDVLYRQWHRRPGDLEALRELRDAISEQLNEALLT